MFLDMNDVRETVKEERPTHLSPQSSFLQAAVLLFALLCHSGHIFILLQYLIKFSICRKNSIQKLLLLGRLLVISGDTLRIFCRDRLFRLCSSPWNLSMNEFLGRPTLLIKFLFIVFRDKQHAEINREKLPG